MLVVVSSGRIEFFATASGPEPGAVAFCFSLDLLEKLNAGQPALLIDVGAASLSTFSVGFQKLFAVDPRLLADCSKGGGLKKRVIGDGHGVLVPSALSRTSEI